MQMNHNISVLGSKWSVLGTGQYDISLKEPRYMWSVLGYCMATYINGLGLNKQFIIVVQSWLSKPLITPSICIAKESIRRNPWYMNSLEICLRESLLRSLLAVATTPETISLSCIRCVKTYYHTTEEFWTSFQ